MRAFAPATQWSIVARELLIMFAAAIVYFGVRGLTEASESEAIANANHLIDLEKSLGIFHEKELQELFLSWRGITTVSNWVYIWGHWPVIAIVGFWLVRWHPRAYFELRNAFLISGGIGIVIFALFPVAPPRLAGIDIVDTVTKHSNSYRVLQPPGLTNQYAALPSLHFGWDLLIGIYIFRQATWPIVRAAGVLLPIAMGLGVVITGNHFFVDPIAGGALALFALWLATGGLRRTYRAIVPAKEAVPLDTEALQRIVAHRAGNSLELIEEAAKSGVHAVEVDIWLHHGRLEVRHSKTLGPVPIRWDRWSLGWNWHDVPTLEEVAAAATAHGVTLWLDLKGGAPGLAERVIATMQEQAPGCAYVVSSQWWDSLVPFEAVAEATVVYSVGSERMLRDIEAREGGMDGVAVHRRYLDAERVTRLHTRAGNVASWPINTPEQLQEALGWGVDRAISDTLWRGRDGREGDPGS
ncbi:MAG: phosphatase PAP2 family protein [Dehalococcoidia bacterium]|nr:phosphatase PAP2 family protein [Dehalococcoidia bacterium]